MPAPKPEVVGETFDGIKILKPVTEPTSFTASEISETVAEIMREHYARLDSAKASSDGKADDRAAS